MLSREPSLQGRTIHALDVRVLDEDVRQKLGAHSEGKIVAQLY